MNVLYSNLEIKNDAFFTPIETHVEPQVEYLAIPNTLYTLILHDPDAVGGNHLHWVIVNINGNNLHTGEQLLEYKGPAPPKGTGKHRYIFLLFEQPGRINAHLYNRSMSMRELYKNLQANLKLISSIYFISKNQDGGKKSKIKKNKTKNITKKYKKLHNKSFKNKKGYRKIKNKK